MSLLVFLFPPAVQDSCGFTLNILTLFFYNRAAAGSASNDGAISASDAHDEPKNWPRRPACC